MSWFQFNPRTPIPPALVEQLNNFPGASLRRGVVRCHLNCAWIVERLLLDAGVRFTVSAPKQPPALPALPFIPELQPFVPEFLFAYQREGVLFGLQRNSALLHHPMGSGKSLTAFVWALADPGQVVFVCRGGVRKQMAREIRRFSTAELYIVEGLEPLPVDEQMKASRARIILIGWETLSAHIDWLVPLHPRSVVFDESHKAKSWKRVRGVPLPDGKTKWVELKNTTAAAKKLSRVTARRLLTTGTPIRDRLRDLWAQLDLMDPWAWGGFSKWAKRYAGAYIDPVSGALQTKGTGSKALLDELAARLTFVMHTVPKSVTHRDLPPMRFACIYIPSSELVKESSGFGAEMKRVAKLGKQAQLEVRLAMAASRKRPYGVQRIVEAVDSGHKVVVFTGRIKDVELLHEAVKKSLAKRDDAVPLWMTHGTPDQRVLDAYMEAAGPAVLIATGDSIGESFNLQDTDYAALAMLPYSPGQFDQWRGRFDRHGRKRPLLVEAWIAEGTVDEHVAEILLSKVPAVERVVGVEGWKEVGDALKYGGKSETEIMDSLLAKILAGGAEAEDGV